MLSCQVAMRLGAASSAYLLLQGAACIVLRARPRRVIMALLVLLLMPRAAADVIRTIAEAHVAIDAGKPLVMAKEFGRKWSVDVVSAGMFSEGVATPSEM